MKTKTLTGIIMAGFGLLLAANGIAKCYLLEPKEINTTLVDNSISYTECKYDLEKWIQERGIKEEDLLIEQICSKIPNSTSEHYNNDKIKITYLELLLGATK